jgi:hypothetical protein
MNWIEAVDVHSGANGCFRRRCVDHEVEALGLRSAELGARGVPVPIDELVSASTTIPAWTDDVGAFYYSIS